jgi:hypothetical protein
VGVRLGYGLPFGKVASDVAMSDNFTGQIPVIIDAGYRFSPKVYVGLYFQYGFVSIKKGDVASSQAFLDHATCSADADCSGSDVRFGLNLHYHIAPTAKVDPWLGLGIGYESISSKVSTSAGETDYSNKGVEIANIQAGLDCNVAPRLALGPFFSLSMAEFLTSWQTDPDSTLAIDNKRIHGWAIIGLRGTYGL